MKYVVIVVGLAALAIAAYWGWQAKIATTPEDVAANAVMCALFGVAAFAVSGSYLQFGPPSDAYWQKRMDEIKRNEETHAQER